MAEKQKQKQDTDDRTGTYGGDDGAMEHERAETQPGEDTGLNSSPAGKTAQRKTQAQQQQDKDLKTGEENPAWHKPGPKYRTARSSFSSAAA